MAAPLFTPGDTDQDEKLNPGQQDANRRFKDQTSGPAYPDVNQGLRDLENHANSSDKSTARDNANDGKSASERENSASNSSFKSTYGTQKNTKASVVGKMSGKKKGGIIGIIVFVLGIFGIGGAMFTPALGMIHMKELFTNDLNDQLAALDIRSNHVFRAKLNNMSSGICTGVQIKCKFSTMNEKQVQRFKDARFIIADEDIKTNPSGKRIKVAKMTAPDGTVINNPADLAKARASSKEVRSAMKRVFNPLYMGMSDKVMNKVLAKNKTSKQKKATGKDEKERRENLKSATAGERANGTVVLTDTTNNKQYVIDENGGRVYADQDRFNEIKAANEARYAELDSKPAIDGKAVSGLIGGAAKGVSALGVADSACTVYNTARAVSAIAKTARSMQLIQYAMYVGTTVDSIKAGDATVEEAEFINTMFSTTDTRKIITDIESEKDIENPNYGKNGFDAAGFKIVSDGDTPILKPTEQQYMVGGGMSGKVSQVINDAKQIVGDPDSACGVIQNPWVRGAGLVLGVVLAIGSAGIGTLVSVGASTAIALTLPFLEAMIADAVAGNVIGENIAGADAGNAYFAGTAALMGSLANGRGMAPMSSTGIQEYAAATQGAKDEMIALEKYEASKEPWNVANQYSFLGSFARSLYPTSVTAKNSVSGAIASVGSVIQQGFASITQPVSAASAYNPQRFNKCKDEGYAALGINADIFCNVRYGLTAQELNYDTEEVVQYMLDKKYITETGKAQGTYKDFLDNCVGREDGWGETSEENGSTGAECVDSPTAVSLASSNTNATLAANTTFGNDISYFRVYTFDNTVVEAMDEEFIPVEEEEEEAPQAPGGSGAIVGGKSAPLPKGSAIAKTYTGGHKGIDFATRAGTPIYAVASGTVVSTFGACFIQSNRGDYCGQGWGNNIVVRHEDGTETKYAHILSRNDILVKEGDTVTAGQHIGNVGSTGSSSGPHLHFEVWVNGSRIGDYGAFNWLKNNGILPGDQGSLIME